MDRYSSYVIVPSPDVTQLPRLLQSQKVHRRRRSHGPSLIPSKASIFPNTNGHPSPHPACPTNLINLVHIAASAKDLTFAWSGAALKLHVIPESGAHEGLDLASRENTFKQA